MPKTPRPKKFQLCLSEEEWQQAEKMATREGMSRSELFRCKTLYRRLPRRTTTIAAETYWQLGQIGNNINQLAKAANTSLKLGLAPPADPGYLEELGALLKQVRREIVELDLLAALEDLGDD